MDQPVKLDKNVCLSLLSEQCKMNASLISSQLRPASEAVSTFLAFPTILFFIDRRKIALTASDLFPL